MLNRNDDQNEAKRMVLFCVAAASMVLLLFLVTLYLHDSKKTKVTNVKQEEDVAAENDDVEVGESNIVSSDLDFWDMYGNDAPRVIEEEDEEDSDDEVKSTSSNLNNYKLKRDYFASLYNSSSSKYSDDAKNLSSSSRTKKVKDEMDDGKHIKVTGSDGKDAWYEILEDLKKNDYKFRAHLKYDNGMLKYNSADAKSVNGIAISNQQGVIDFNKVKNAGIQYVMIRVASRGYETGQINIDDKFVEYANGATAAGLQIGTYITSNAITDVEAVEEANYAVAASNNYNIKYPIALDFSGVSSGKARTEKLTSSERTDIVKTFCNTVKTYGRTPAICASRDFLITNLDLDELEDYDIWLKDEAVIADYMMRESVPESDEEAEAENDSTSTSSSSRSSSSSKKSSSSSSSSEIEEEPDYIGTDYPYEFSMWQYSEKGTINGIEGQVNLNMSFVNYAER